MSVYIDVDEIEVLGQDFGPPYFIEDVGAVDKNDQGFVLASTIRFRPGLEDVAKEFGLTVQKHPYGYGGDLLFVVGKLESLQKVQEYVQRSYTRLSTGRRSWRNASVLGPSINLSGTGRKGTQVEIFIEYCGILSQEKIRAVQRDRANRLLSDSVHRII